MNTRLYEFIKQLETNENEITMHRDNYNDSTYHDDHHDNHDDRYFDSHYDDRSRYDDKY